MCYAARTTRTGRQVISSFEDDDEKAGREKVELEGFSIEPAESVRSEIAAIDRILSYFEQKTGGRRFPCRADIAPVDLKDILPNVCLMSPQIDQEGRVMDGMIDLMGTNVVSFYGELTGRSIFDHPAPAVSKRILASMQAAYEQKRPIVAEAFRLSEEKDYLRVSVLYIPMSENGEAIDRFFLLVQVRSNRISA